MLPGRKYSPDVIVRLLKKRKWIMLVPMAVGLFLGLLVSRSRPESYVAETVVQVLPQRVPDNYVRPTVTSTVEERLKSIQEMVKSRTLLSELITTMDLYAEQRRSGPISDSLIEVMRRNVAITVSERGPGSFRGGGAAAALRVTFTYGEKEKALLVTRRLTEILVEENAKMRGTQANQTSQFLERELADARKQLEEQENRLETFKQTHQGALPEQIQVNMQAAQNAQLQLQQLTQQLAQDRDRKLYLERLYNDAVAAARVAPVVPAQTGPVSTDPTAVPANASAQQRLAAARNSLAAAELRLTPEHPDIKRLHKQISDLEKLVQAEAQRPTSTATTGVTVEELARREAISTRKAEIESIDRQIANREREIGALRGQIALYQSRIEAVPGNESEYVRLTRNYNTTRETYESLLQKAQESKVSANAEEQQVGEQFHILDQARVSDQATGANRLVINVGGMFLGLIMGIVVVGFLEVRDTSFRTEADVMNSLSLPVLAAVPYAPTAADLATVKKRRLLFSTVGAVSLLASAVVFAYLQLWKFLV